MVEAQNVRSPLLERFERATEVPLLVLALAMVPLIVIPLLVDLSPGAESFISAADWFIWAGFAFEFIVRLALTDHRLRFLRREWPDLLIVVLPFLRPLRVVRSARALRLLRLSRLAAVLAEVTVNARRLFVRHHLDLALLVTAAVVVGFAGIAYAVEDGHGGSIDSFGDALWWAATTVTTVGYGDTFPVTAAGRGVGVLLMLAGITLFGVITANLAAYFVDASPQANEQATNEAQAITELSAQVERLTQMVAVLDARLAGPTSRSGVGER